MKDLMKSTDGRELVVLIDKLENNPATLRKFITMLTIPMYKQLTHVMFYDVLQMLCHKVNLVNFNKDRVKADRRRAKVLR